MCVCDLKIGAGKASINLPKEIFPIEKFSDINDDIRVRVLLIESNVKIAIVSYELTSLRPYEIEKIKEIIYAKADIDKDNIWVCVTHTFSAPHVRSEKALSKADNEIVIKNKVFCEKLEEALNTALNKALENREAAKIGFGNGSCCVNISRDIYTPSGWWIGNNNNGVSDKSVPVIRFDNLEGEPIAVIYSYDVQSSIMDKSFLEDGTRIITGDLTGKSSSYIESLYGDEFVAMYIVGAAGDQSPVFKANQVSIDSQGNLKEEDIGRNGLRLVEELGAKLGNEVVKTIESVDSYSLNKNIVLEKTSIKCPGQVMPKDIKEIKPTHIYEYINDEDREVDLDIISIGEVSIVGLMPEISSITAMDIRRTSPFKLTMVLTMVNGGAKYMADEISYDRNTYSAMNSKFGKGSAEIVAKEAIKKLEEIVEK